MFSFLVKIKTDNEKNGQLRILWSGLQGNNKHRLIYCCDPEVAIEYVVWQGRFAKKRVCMPTIWV
jgi:hypothetical protein